MSQITNTFYYCNFLNSEKEILGQFQVIILSKYDIFLCYFGKDLIQTLLPYYKDILANTKIGQDDIRYQ